MKTFLLSICLATGLTVTGYAQENLSYQLPPKSIVDLVDAPTSPSVQFSPDGKLMLILQTPGYASIEQVAQPVIGLAGLRINPANNSTEGELSGVFNGITIKNLISKKDQQISGLPKDLRLTNISWSPDGQYFAFSNNTLKGVELWFVNLQSMAATRLTSDHLNDAFGTTLQWSPDSKSILAQFIPSRGAAPVQPIVPTGPVVQENLGVVTPSRTYQNLLQNNYDQELMEYYLRSQLVQVSLDGGVKFIGEPAIYRSASYSPDGKYLLSEVVEKPYSYLVPIYYFPYQASILNLETKAVKVLYNAPLAEKLPSGFDAVATGPRSFEWRKDVPSTVVWAEAQDKGDPAVKTEVRDALFTLKAPFTDAPKELIKLNLRYGGINWGNQQYAVLKENWRKDRTVKMSLINPETGKIVKVIAQRSSEDTYTDPGDFVSNKGILSRSGTLLLDKATPVVYTIGGGASPQGDRPFLMRWNLLNNKQDTLFKSKAPYYEEPVYYNHATGSLYFSRESAEQAPNYLVSDLKSKKETALTQFADPYPSLQGVQKSLLSYPRKDGIKLSATLYLPKGYKKSDGPLPALVWAYPREFKSLAAAGQVKGSPYRFTRLAFRSPVFWVTRGYAVLDQADMPIVGEGKEEPNDTFLEQIEANAVALINYVSDDLGVVDRKRIGVGGHSYGAFMTANLLAHTDLFAAGIARSGAYNRTLTPFGFQGESRTFWEAEDVYNKMSPFNYANKIKTPILLTHGIDDENSGTFPIQSERLYSAIKGHGGTVRLVLLPKEFHGYRSRESILHTFYEQDNWLEKYVKNRK
ncbi:prolyl oligopeptidase family serine peptidase [Pedobacter antarcticus]|uniref:prolyl oligopeptidase family serine peptidase n=1 Tax=Pedobacter antarcticus TaxID=34086 RepID=UPI002931974D|nr:prolyl oligopeptidase family serine peptidase [Pedobacter antarcticus]